ncbi:MAG TPA: hypothetical protein VFS11_01900 [Gemmatimonadales bacterium]|nr:hypothetical protein [Gemmatimonadales bacterium]
MKVMGPSGLPAAYQVNGPQRAQAATPAAPVGPAKPAAPATHATSATVASASAASEVPPGSDPALWAVLTAEERSFFQRQAALGPLTYGRGARPTPTTAPVGGRIDVRA